MKRLLLIVLLLALMMQPALADTCFYQQGVMLLHADPFCSGTPPEFLPLDAVSTDAPEAAVCAYCPICWRMMTQTDELDALRSRLPEPQRYFNPKGGEMYHYDAECVAVNKRYLPMKGQFLFSQINDAPYKSLENCTYCGAPLRNK